MNVKTLVFALLATSLNLSSTDLKGTTWIQLDASSDTRVTKCPVVLSFEENSYKYGNECHGKGRNKIVEWGTYDVVDSSIWLEDRKVVVGGHSIFGEDAATMALESISIGDSVMTFRIGEQLFRFKMKH
jgi:hypothetical protein